jgi:Type I phosphodiesterase / nucleotide pyrophosphatase
LLPFRVRKPVFLLVPLLLVSLLGANAQSMRYGSAKETADQSREKNVILLGWDGVQRDHLLDLMDRKLMPNLSSFVEEGRMVNITVTDHATDTKAGWTQILTGYKWWRTGVFDNIFWFKSVPAGYTIPERLENIYGKDNIVTAFIKGKVNHMETVNGTNTAQMGTPWSIYTNDAIFSNLPSELDVINSGYPDNGAYNDNNDRYADVIGPVTLQFLQNNANNHFFAFIHFSDPDHIGHAFGEDSVEYEDAIKTCDDWLGQILTTLNTFNITQNTLIYITSDHGMDEGTTSHSFAPYIFLATNDQNVVRNGDEVDIAPTVYYGLGLWNQIFNPGLDGYPLQISLPPAEAEKRETALSDSVTIPTPTISITEGESQLKTVTFSARDNNLAAVLLLVDNRMKSDGPWNWTQTGDVIATGSYILNTTSLSDGLHTVKILAFDEHGAFNGGTENYPAGGGYPGMNKIDFYIGIPPSPTPNLSISPPFWTEPSPSPTSYTSSIDSSAPSSSPPQSPAPQPTLPPSVSPPPSQPDLSKGSEKEESRLEPAIYLALIVISILTIAMGAYRYSNRRDAHASELKENEKEHFHGV